MSVKRVVIIGVVAVAMAACGGDPVEGSGAGDEVASGEAGQAGGSSGALVSQQPPGQAYASVDGQEFTFDTPGLVDCAIAPDSITFSYVIGDNEVGLAGGANLYEDGWLGDVTLRVLDDDGLPVQYFPEMGAMDAGVAIDGDSFSYSGPMLKRPPNDGSNPPDEEVGSGTISVTCG